MRRILVIDDDQQIRDLFRRILGREYELRTEATFQGGIDALEEEVFDLVITDLTLPDGSGIDILQRIQPNLGVVPVIMITGYASVETAVEAMKLGALDYISKPFQIAEIQMVLKRALERQELTEEVSRLRRWASEQYGFQGIIGKSKPMRELFDLVQRVADTPSTVLIQGESGTGKELFARAIHQNSSRANRPFLAINCGALPEPLLESELFGHAKGAFTGAIRAKKGLFLEASGGTIFLDEIGEISAAVQTKLLRVLQDREVRPVGSNESVKVDTRVLVATNRDLKAMVSAGQFREDIYYRLSVIPLTIPPLRERTEDIPLLVDHFLQTLSSKMKVRRLPISALAMHVFLEYPWPGNVRELENVLERLLLTVEGDVIEPGHLPEELQLAAVAPEEAPEPPPALDEQVVRTRLERRRLELEREAIAEALRLAGGNKAKAARMLGISRSSMYNKIRELNLAEAPGVSKELDT